ncbi:MAG: MGMT family protein [Myxococcota bacterium]
MSRYAPLYALVRRIPKGRVMTYGQLADLVDPPLSARAVGWAMHQCPEDVPWWRVVNARGECSVGERQERRLTREGVAFVDGRLDLARRRWRPE